MSDELSGVEIGPYEPGDEHEILRVFAKVFDVQRPLRHWNWQYRDNPEGVHCFLARLPDGRVVSQFTGIPRRVKVGGEELCFAEIVDSLTDPDFRSGLKKPGLFATTCYRFVDHYGRRDGEVVMYGLPNRVALRVGRALLGYVPMYPVECLSQEVSAVEPVGDEVLAGGAGTARRVEAFGADVDALYDAVKDRYDVMTVRRSRYLNWRYAERPDVDYHLLELRDGGGRLFGATVLRHGWLDEPLTAVADWLVDRDHPLARAAADHLCGAARAAGSRKVQALFRPGSPEALGLGEKGFVPEPTQWRLVARTYDRTDVPLDRLRDGWYVTLGDFDVV